MGSNNETENQISLAVETCETSNDRHLCAESVAVCIGTGREEKSHNVIILELKIWGTADFIQSLLWSVYFFKQDFAQAIQWTENVVSLTIAFCAFF